MNHHTLRLTPSNSPFFKNTTPRSPTKTRGDEAGLRLRRIVGTTTSSVNGFDCLPAKRQFAYCAGSSAVVATVDDDLKVTQRFFRARPTSGNNTRDGPAAFPVTPTPNEARTRALGHVRDHTIGGSPLGASTRDWSDSPSGKSATAKDRVKAATSVALSPNGKWVAVGETGYKPRILLFSNGGDSSESPVCILAEHTFGVQALSFSPDSRHLASLGTVNDGFLYLWSIDDRTGAASLHSSNKCTVTINAMIWLGRNLLTVGLRFVKVWRPNEEATSEIRASDSTASLGTPKQRTTDFGNSILGPTQKVLAGKNSLLGELLDCNFICAVPLSNDSAVVCSESGEVAFLEDVSKTQALRSVALVESPVSAARIESDGFLHVYGTTGASHRLEIAKLQESAPFAVKRDRRQTISPTKSAAIQSPVMTATATLGDFVLEMDSRRNIQLTRSPSDETGSDLDVSHQMPAHNDAVLGVKSLSSSTYPEAEFLTFSGNGAVRLWSSDGTSASASFKIPVESSAEMYDQTNELKAVAAMAMSEGEYIVAGDRYGTLTLLDLQTGDVTTQIRAHSAEIADVVAFEQSGLHLVASCSRDRTIQLFAWSSGQLDLVQTLDEHAAAVNGLLVMNGGDRLLSHSQDRTVTVREAVLRQEDDTSSIAYMMTRSISLKSSPTALCPAGNEDEILVSAMDRCVGLYNVRTGQAGFNFKCSDNDGGESVAMSKIAYEPSLNGNPAIIGIAGSDKSVRFYSEYGSLIARDWGHTEGITDLAVLRSRGAFESEAGDLRIVTVAVDSTVFVWDTLPPLAPEPVAETNGLAGATPNTLTTPLRPPLRKVLSYSELSRFKREKSIDEGNESPTQGQRQPSPQRLRKKPSKISIAQAPKLEPAFRGEHARRRSLRKRSPSPPSPRTRKDAGPARKPSLGMALRSKSSENVLNGVTSPTMMPTANTGFGSLTASTESVCRTLRAYRKKVTTSSAAAREGVAADVLRELETEMKLLEEVLGERLPGMMKSGGGGGVGGGGGGGEEEAAARAMEEASERIVRRLDERVKARVEDGLRKSSDEGMSSATAGGGTGKGDEEGGEAGDGGGGGGGGGEDVEAVAGALERVTLGGK